jgi:hypothetical protein
VLLEHKVL